MYFQDSMHQANFMEICEKYPEKQRDREYMSAYYLMSQARFYHELKGASPTKWMFEEESEDFSEAFGVLSSTEKIQAKLAAHLFGIGVEFPLVHALSSFDSKQMQVLYQAIAIRSGRDPKLN